MLIAMLAVDLLASNPGTACTHETVRTAKSTFGVVATEELRLCTPNSFIVTAHNEIFVRTSTRADIKPALVARLESVGRIGVPLTWKGKTLVIHLPKLYKRSFVQVLHPRVGDVSLAIVNDYSDEQSLQDSRR